METVSSICAALCIICVLLAPVMFIVFLVMLCTKNKRKKIFGFLSLGLVLAIIPFTIIGTLTDPTIQCEHQWEIIETVNSTCTEKGHVTKHCSLCNKVETEYIDELGHSMREIKRIDPTKDEKGKIIRKCDRCGLEEVDELDKIPTDSVVPELTTQPTEEVTTDETIELSTKESETVIQNEINTSITFDEIYHEYKENELRADDKYKNNRYRITAIINGMSTGGLFNLTGGATLTMETRVDNTIVFFYAEFEKDQEEALKTINVGDTITFEGECLSAKSWVDCKLIK